MIFKLLQKAVSYNYVHTKYKTKYPNPKQNTNCESAVKNNLKNFYFFVSHGTKTLQPRQGSKKQVCNVL